MIAQHTTIDQFFAALAEVPRLWRLEGTAIRCCDDGDPITETAMAFGRGKYKDHQDWERAADDIGLDGNEAADIGLAIDGILNDHPKLLRLRARLIEVCKPRT